MGFDEVEIYLAKNVSFATTIEILAAPITLKLARQLPNYTTSVLALEICSAQTVI